MGFILFIVAVVLVSALFIIGVLTEILFSIITLRWKKGIKEANKFFLRMAVSLDMFGNVVNARFLQLTMTKKGGYLFGEYGQTVSFVLGMNARTKKLTWFGRFIVWVLDKLDKNHCEKAIESQRIQDLKALKRLNG